MQKKKLKQLLHKHNEKKRAENKENRLDSKQDDILQLNYVSEENVKSDKSAAYFNAVRRKNVKEVLNKFKHPFSQHIRLKPYYDAGEWLHWIGVFSDLTLPNADDNLNGDILIDKLTTGDNKELLDYHAWLNLENVKYIRSKKQKLSIGDIIEGESKVLRYNQNKYGLGTTIIRKAGIYKGKDHAETLVGKYDRQDDWVLEIDNSSASDRAWEAYQESGSKDDFETEPGHVEVRYQPSRYQRYRERLEEIERKTSDTVLPLVSPKMTKYHGFVDQIHAVKTNNVSYMVPQINIRHITNDHGRLISANAVLPYTQEMKKMGEVEIGDEVTFEASSSPNEHYLFGTIDKFTLLTKHEYYPLPEFPNTFLGYLMWKNPSEGEDPTLVMNYQNWALARDIHTDEIKEEIKELTPKRQLTEHELAVRFGVKDSVINSAYRQGVIQPVSKENELKYDVKAWQILVQLLSAQDPHSVQTVKNDLNVYSEDDLAHKFKFSIDEIRDRIRKTDYLPLNGFHYKVNLYGKKVYEMFNAKQKVKDLLPPKQDIQTTREIPKDRDYTEKFVDKSITATEIPKLESKYEEIKALPAPIIEYHEEKKQQAQAGKINFVSKVNRPRREQQYQSNKVTNVTIEIETFDGSYLDSEFKSFKEADQFIETTANKKFTNRFLHVKNAVTGEDEVISTKAITSFKVKK